MSNDPMRIRPEDLRLTASDLNRLSGDAHQFQNGLQRAWARLDSGWDWYAEGNITAHFQQTLEEVNRMAAMFSQMNTALTGAADLIEQADQVSVGLFDNLIASQAGEGGNGKSPGLAKLIQQGGGPPPPPPVYAGGMTEAQLAALQEHQGARNDCGEYAIAAALDLLYGGDVDGSDIAQLADLSWWQGTLVTSLLGILGRELLGVEDMRLWPNGPTTPQQQVNIVNAIARQGNINLAATARQLTTTELINLLGQSNTAVLVTIGWNDSNIPQLARNSDVDPVTGAQRTRAGGGAPLEINAHAMLLAAYDPTHLDADGNPAPWGFVNSWENGGSEIFWMPDADFNQAWDHNIPVIGSNNAVVVMRDLPLPDPPPPTPTPQPVPTPSTPESPTPPPTTPTPPPSAGSTSPDSSPPPVPTPPTSTPTPSTTPPVTPPPSRPTPPVTQSS